MLLPKLVIPITNALQVKYNTPQTANLFNGDNLVIKVNPGKYTPVFEGREIKLFEGLTGKLVDKGRKRYGFDLELQDGRIQLYYVLREIIDTVQNANQFIALHDYCFPEYNDSAQGYTVRQGIITELAPVSGSLISAPSDYYQGGTDSFYSGKHLTKGLKLKFLESVSRF